ncbi:MAG: hypothetical protein VB070_10735 [Clostridiaceae bacterium]|nr:hypothetical protein [Clostridiaceae bacterium]
MKPKVALVGLSGEFEIGFDQAPALMKEAVSRLTASGVDLIDTRCVLYNDGTVKQAVERLKGGGFDALCVCVATWSEDHYLLDILELLHVPVILWAFPAIHTGSLCGTHQICSVLKELDKPYFFVYGSTDDQKAVERIVIAARAASLYRRMKQVRIGTVGGRVKGMTEIACDEFEIKQRIGARIINLDESELSAACDAVSAEAAAFVWQNAKSCAGQVLSSDSQGAEAARLYLAMKRLIGAYALDGICVKCYPNFMGKVCLGYTLLSGEGIVCGCEGDVMGTVAMKLLSELTGGPVHNTDLLYPEPEGNTILFSHCGSGAFSLAAASEDVQLAPVRLAENGVCTLFPARPGVVTLINLVGRRGTLRLSAIVGEAVACGMVFPGNPLKVHFQPRVTDLVQNIAEEGIGHHWMAGYGNVIQELEAFCALAGVRMIRL